MSLRMNKIKTINKPYKSVEIPSPTEEEIKSEYFKAIFNVIKKWDISTEGDFSYCSGNGSHVKIILDKLKPLIRNEKINKIINE